MRTLLILKSLVTGWFSLRTCTCSIPGVCSTIFFASSPLSPTTSGHSPFSDISNYYTNRISTIYQYRWQHYFSFSCQIISKSSALSGKCSFMTKSDVFVKKTAFLTLFIFLRFHCQNKFIEQNLQFFEDLENGLRHMIIIVIDCCRMRPSSAPRPNNNNRKTHTKDIYRPKPIKNNQGSNRSIPIFDNSDSLAGMAKPIDTKLKTLGMLHAYKPSLLKQCMISDKTSMKKFAKSGQCNLNDIFIKTALALFHDWREKINSKLMMVIDAVTSSEQLMDPAMQAKIKEVFAQLKQYSNKIRTQIQDLASKQENFKLNRLRVKFVLLLQTIEHVLILVDIMRCLSSEVDNYLQLKKINGGKDAEIEEGVRSIAQKYERKATDSLNYCICHPDNQLLLRLQFKVRKMFMASTQKVKTIFQSIRSLQQYQSSFKKQLLFLQNFQDFSHEYLGHVLQTLYSKNEQIKLIQKKYQVSKMSQFISLRSRIEDWQTNFIKKLRTKTVNYFKKTLISLSRIRTLHLIKSKGKEYVDVKKFMVLLGKIYQQSQKQSNITADYYQFEKKAVNQIITALNESTAALSPCIETITQKIDSLESIKDKQTNSAIKNVEKSCQMIEAIQKAQNEAWIVINSNYIRLSRLSGQNPEIMDQGLYSDKNTLESLNQLISFSRKQQQNNQIFKQLRNSLAKNQDIDAMLLSYENLYKIHQEFLKGGLQAGLQKARQLRDILKDELIIHLFGEQFKGQFIGGYFGIKQVCIMQQKLIDQAGKEYLNGVAFFRYSPPIVEELRRTVNDQIKKLDQNKQRTILNKYIILIYQCLLIQLLNVKQIYRLFSSQESNLQPYRAVFHEYVQVYENSLGKNRRDQTYFATITAKIYSICAVLNQQNRLICEYRNSRNSNQYFPSIQYLTEWIKLQYSAEIEQIINKNAVKVKRTQLKTIFDQFVKKMDVQREKIKSSNMKSQNKEIYQHIGANIEGLKQIDFSEKYQQLLLKLMKYLEIMNEPHSVIFTQDQSPVYIVLSSSDQQEINDLLLQMLGLGNKSKLQSIITPFNFKNKTTHLVQQKKKEMVVDKSQKLDQLIQEIPINEQAVDEITPEELIQEIESNLPVSSVLKPNNDDKKQKNKSNPEPSVRLFNYYKLQQIQSIKQLKSRLYYHNNEYSTIQQKLNISLLCQALKPKGRQVAHNHIKQILEQIDKTDIFRTLKLCDYVPECECQLVRFQEAIQRNGNIRSELLQLLDYFKVEKKIVYQQKGNFIEYFRKHNQKTSFLSANLVENCYKQDMKKFQIDQIIESVWKGVNATINGGPISNFITEISRKIEGSNSLIMAYYRDIQQRLSNFNENCSNRKEIQQQINSFTKEIFNNKRCIQTIKAISMKDLLNWLNILQKNLRGIPILQQFFTLKLDQNVLYIDSIQITKKIIMNCLFLPPMDDSFSKCITYSQGSAIINVYSLRTYLISMTKANPISFAKIEQFFSDLDRQKLIEEMKIVDDNIRIIVSFGQYAKFFDNDLEALLVNLKTSLTQTKSILSFVLDKNYQKIRKIEQFSINRQIYMVDGSSQITHLICYQDQFLDNLATQLQKNKVNFHKLKYGSQTIALLQNNRLLNFAEKLSISKSKVAELQKQLVSEQNCHTIKRLYVTFCGIVPNFEHYDEAIQNKIQVFLRECILHIKQGSKIVTQNCQELLKKGNLVEVQVEWPKLDIHFTFMSRQSTINITVPSVNYYYFADIQLLTLRTHIIADFEKIKLNHLAELRKAEEQALQQQIRKQQRLALLQRAQHQKQMQKLRMQQERARLKFGTDELNRKNRQRQAAQKAKLKFIEEITLSKLKQQYQEPQKQQQKTINNKLNHLSETSPLFNSNQDFLEFQMCLSEGQDDRFEEEKHNIKQDVQYDYRITLYQYIRQTYHSLRKKPIDVDSWFQHF